MSCSFGDIESKSCTVVNYTEIFCKFNKDELASISIPKFFKRLTVIGNVKHLKLSNDLSLNFLHIEDCETFTKKLKYYKFPNIVYLTITNSNLVNEDLKNNIFASKLQYLDLSKNPITTLEFIRSFKLSHRIYLNISFTSLNSFTFLKYFKFIKVLDIKQLNLPLNTTKLLKNLIYLNSDNFYICCTLWNFVNEKSFCQPSKTKLNSCSGLIQTQFIGTFFMAIRSYWIFIKSNSFSIFFNFFKKVKILF